MCHIKSLKLQFYGRAVLLSECPEPSEHASLNVTAPISLDMSKFPSNNTFKVNYFKVNYCFATDYSHRRDYNNDHTWAKWTINSVMSQLEGSVVTKSTQPDMVVKSCL